MEVLKPQSWRVQHQHRLGSCAGRLGVSRKGLTFTPDDRSSKDAFTLPHDQFIAATDDRTIVIKSNTKTYRFKVPAGAPGGAASIPVEAVIHAIAAFR